MKIYMRNRWLNNNFNEKLKCSIYERWVNLRRNENHESNLIMLPISIKKISFISLVSFSSLTISHSLILTILVFFIMLNLISIIIISLITTYLQAIFGYFSFLSHPSYFSSISLNHLFH